MQLWFDRNGNFHILYHVYTLAHDYKIERCSGHAWSRDGIDWSYSQVHQPFNCASLLLTSMHRAVRFPCEILLHTFIGLARMRISVRMQYLREFHPEIGRRPQVRLDSLAATPDSLPHVNDPT